MRNCRLVSLLDLDLSKEYVRGKIVSYLNRLIDIGVAGFRVDAVKHMWPGDLQVIYDRMQDLSTDAGFEPYTRPFIFNEASLALSNYILNVYKTHCECGAVRRSVAPVCLFACGNFAAERTRTCFADSPFAVRKARSLEFSPSL